MGLRNPFRIEYNLEEDELYVADYSPDAQTSRTRLRGPAGQGKWMVITEPANYGWPYCATAELPYVDYDFDHRPVGRDIRLRQPGQRVAPQHRADRAPAGDPATGLVLLRRLRGVPRARDRRHRPDGRAGVPVRPQGGPAAGSRRHGRRTTTTCRCSTNGRATTSRSSAWTPRAPRWPPSTTCSRRSTSRTRWTSSSARTARCTCSTTGTGSSARTSRARNWRASTSSARPARGRRGTTPRR